MIKAVLWDLDNTVLNFTAAERASLRRALKVLGYGECSDGMLEEYARVNIRHWEALERGEKTQAQVLADRFREFLGMYGFDPSGAEALNAEYEPHIPDTIVFIPGALETLKQLKGKVIQCCATNGAASVQRRRLRESGLGEIFDHVFISEEMGAKKPDREYFDMVLAELKDIKREEILMVGDSLTSDMRGAANAGIKKCWYNPARKSGNVPFEIEYEVENPGEIADIINNEESIR